MTSSTTPGSLSFQEQLLAAAEHFDRTNDKARHDILCRLYDDAKKSLYTAWWDYYNNDYYNLAIRETECLADIYGEHTVKKLVKCVESLKEQHLLNMEISSGIEPGIYRGGITEKVDIRVRAFMHFTECVANNEVYQQRRAAHKALKQLVLQSPLKAKELLSKMSYPATLIVDKITEWKTNYPPKSEQAKSKLKELTVV